MSKKRWETACRAPRKPGSIELDQRLKTFGHAHTFSHLPKHCIVLWVHTAYGTTSLCILPWAYRTWQNIILRILYVSVHTGGSARSLYIKRQWRHLALEHRTKNKAARLGRYPGSRQICVVLEVKTPLQECQSCASMHTHRQGRGLGMDMSPEGWTWDRFFHIVLNLSWFLLAML